MAEDRNPNDPPRSHTGPQRREEEFRSAAMTDSELQPDPELAEGPASTSRVTLYAIVAIIVLAAVFYGLNSTTTPTDTASRPTPATTQPGTTTGAAPSSGNAPPAQPSPPPAAGGGNGK